MQTIQDGNSIGHKKKILHTYTQAYSTTFVIFLNLDYYPHYKLGLHISY